MGDTPTILEEKEDAHRSNQLVLGLVDVDAGAMVEGPSCLKGELY